MNALCFPRSNPNPLAPAWLFPSEWTVEAPPGYRDEFMAYPLTQALTAGQVVTATLDIDVIGQCAFYWGALGVTLYGGAGVPAVRIRDASGHQMLNTRVLLQNDAPFGRRDYMTPLPVPYRLEPGAQMAFDFRETDGVAPVTVAVLLVGIRRSPDSAALAGRGGAAGVAA